MRLRFLRKRSDDLGGGSAVARVFFIDPLKTPTVASLSDFLREKLNIGGGLSLFLGEFLVDPADTIAVFDHDDVVTIGLESDADSGTENNAERTQSSENASGRPSILKKRKTVSICGFEQDDTFSKDDSMRVNPPSTPRADLSVRIQPMRSPASSSGDDSSSDDSDDDEDDDEDDEGGTMNGSFSKPSSSFQRQPIITEPDSSSSSEEETDDEPPKPPASLVRAAAKPSPPSSSEEESDDEPPKPPSVFGKMAVSVGATPKPAARAASSESEETETESEEDEVAKPEAKRMKVGGVGVAVAGSAGGGEGGGSKRKRKRKRGRRGKGSPVAEQPAKPPQLQKLQNGRNQTINLSSDAEVTSDPRLPKAEWDKLRRNKRLATVNFVPASHHNRNRHVRFDPDDVEIGAPAAAPVVDGRQDVGGQTTKMADERNEREESMDHSSARPVGGFGGNASYSSTGIASASRFMNSTLGSASRHFPPDFAGRPPSASSTPIRLMPRQVRLSREPNWAISKNKTGAAAPQSTPASNAAATGALPVVAENGGEKVDVNGVGSPGRTADAVLKKVHLSESQTNKSRIFRNDSPSPRPVNGAHEKSVDDKDLKEPFDTGVADGEAEKENAGDTAVKNFLNFPLLKPNVPKRGDKIAFKILEMSETMCPEISAYKEASVLDFNPSTDEISLQVTVNAKPPPVDDNDAMEDDDDEAGVRATLKNGVGIEIMDVKWGNVIEPRLLTS